MESADTCGACNGKMEFVKNQDMNGTNYKVMKCSKCNKQVIRREEQ